MRKIEFTMNNRWWGEGKDIFCWTIFSYFSNILSNTMLACILYYFIKKGQWIFTDQESVCGPKVWFGCPSVTTTSPIAELKLPRVISRWFKLKVFRENWLSPVIQTTWEARTVGWQEEDRLIPTGGLDSGAVLWPPCLGKVFRGGQTPITREEFRLQAATQKKPEFEPQPDFPNIARPSSQ